MENKILNSNGILREIYKMYRRKGFVSAKEIEKTLNVPLSTIEKILDDNCYHELFVKDQYIKEEQEAPLELDYFHI